MMVIKGLDPRWLIFGVIILAFSWSLFWKKYPIGFALIVGAVAGSLVAGDGLPVRHLVEGAFTYFDPMLIIFTALVFMKVLEGQGVLHSLSHFIVNSLSNRPVLMGITLTLFIMLPAMLTGITTTSVLTTGAVVAPLFLVTGMTPARVGALIGFISVMGMIAPPINLLAMIMGQGVDMPYIGFTFPLSALSFPVALVSMFFWGVPYLRKTSSEKLLEALGSQKFSLKDYQKGFRVGVISLGGVFLWMILTRTFPQILPDVGVPLIFCVGAVISLIIGKRLSLIKVVYEATVQALPILAVLAGVGAFLQVLTLVGVRGMLVVTTLALPEGLKWAGLIVVLPLSGGVSAFAATMVFGIPYLLSMLSANPILVCAAISTLVGLGDLLPPTGINARLSAEVVKVEKWMQVTKEALPMLILTAIWATLLIAFSGKLGFLTPNM